MLLNLYSIYDTVSEVFNKPFTEINDASARRAFAQSLLENPQKTDYQLYHIAEYYDHSGEIISNKAPLKIMTGFDLPKITSISPEMQLADLDTFKKQSGE